MEAEEAEATAAEEEAEAVTAEEDTPPDSFKVTVRDISSPLQFQNNSAIH